MKKRTLNLFLLSILFFAASCNNDKAVSADKIKSALASINTCILQCNEKEARCIAEHDSCIADANAARSRAGVTCSHVPPGNRIACINEAIDKLLADRKECDNKFKICLGEVAACRKACDDALRATLEPDTR
jgi:hypothetical protein